MVRALETVTVSGRYSQMRVVPSEPGLTLEGLYHFIRMGHPATRCITHSPGSKPNYPTLRRRFPHAEIALTQKNSESEQILDQAGLDPELFAYQLRMNAQEGGADQLFSFRARLIHELLLELMVNPSGSPRRSPNSTPIARSCAIGPKRTSPNASS